jgi:hypothetical protein
VSVRTIEYSPARGLCPFEYAIAAEICRSVGYTPSGMIQHEPVDGPPVYLFFGESSADITEEAFNIRDRIFARIASCLTVKITDAKGMAEGWVRHKKLALST